MIEHTKHRMRCPQCGHDTMHYGETVEVRGTRRADVFSCRGCGSAWESDEIKELRDEYTAALDLILGKE